VPGSAHPNLIGVFPANGSTVSMADVVLYLVFDEILGPTPVVTYLLPGGVTPNSAYIDYDQNVMVISLPSLSLTGVYTFTVQDGTVKDQDFNVDPEHISFSVDLENGLPPVAPRMVATSFWTGDSQTSVTPGARLQFLFSAGGLSKGAGIMELHTEDGALVESIDVASAGTNGALFAGGWSLTFWGLPLHPGQSYYLYAPAGVLVGSGGASEAFTYHFTAAGTLDSAPPVLTASSPADNQTLAPLTGDITLTFNEPIKLGSGNFGIYRSSGHSLVKTIAASSASIGTDGKTVILKTGILLDQATQYYVLADTGSVLDMSDNGFAGISNPATLNFITTPLPSLPSDTQPWALSGNGQLAAGRTLSVTHDGHFSNEAVIYLEPPQDGTEFVFQNYGSIQGKISGFPGIMAGMFVDTGTAQTYYRNAYLQNYGAISVSGDMVPLGVNNIGSPTGDAAIGIYDPGGFNFPHLENMPTGTINVAAWRAWGIYENGGGGGDPINRGAITVRGADGAYGYYTVQNNTPSFSNAGLISVHGGNGIATFGVRSELGSFTRIENSGRIEVWADSNAQNATGIGISDGFETIINSGVIVAPIAINVHAVNGGSTLLITNTGQITGNIYLGGGASNVFDGSSGTYTGTIHGAGRSNVIHAGAGDSTLIAGDRTLITGPSDDTRDGGPGIDTAVFSNARSAYSISQTGGNHFTISGPDGSDTLIGIEFARFTDQTVALTANQSPIADFNGDGKSDILWQNDNGQAALWLMNGFSQIGNDAVGGNPGPSWHIKGSGDFNGDGNADVLWQNDNGQAALWLVNGFTQIGNDAVGGNPGPSWHIKGTGDFNGDGKADILWQNDNGQAALWLMNGFTQIGNGAVGGNPGPSWHIKGTGDFNGDGKSDILWQNDNGQAALWLLNGFSQIGNGAVGGTPGPTWHIKDTEDFNGDRRSDILWQNDNGQAALWLLNGFSQIGNGAVGDTPGPAWHIKTAADANGDGLSDILWQNDNGQAALWLLSGTNLLSNGVVGPNPGTSWHMIAASS